MSIEFDGVNDSINCRSSGGVVNWVNGAAAATMMVWSRIDVVARQEVLMGCSINNGGTQTNDSRMALEKNSAGALFGIGQAGDGTALQTGTDTGSPVAGVTGHYATRFNVAADQICMYRQGVNTDCDAVAFPGAAFTNTGSASARFGSDESGSPLFFLGRLEDGRIYARLLSDAEMQTIHACQGHDGIVLALTGRYCMNEGSPGVVATGVGTIKDVSNNQRHGDPVNGPTWQETPLTFRRRYQ